MIGLAMSVSADTLSSPSVIGPIAAAIAVTAGGATARPLVASPKRPPLAPRTTGSSTDSRMTWRRPRRLLGAFGTIVVAFVAGPLAFGVAVLAAVLVRQLGTIRAARRRRATIERSLPDAMDLLVLGVRAGLTPFQAVCDLATSGEPTIADACAEVVRRTERGQPFADALGAFPQYLGTQAGGLADVIATSDRHGLPLGPVLDQLSIEIRAARRRLDQADARKLPVRLSFPLVMCTLPSFVLLAIAPAVIAALSSLGGTAW